MGGKTGRNFAAWLVIENEVAYSSRKSSEEVSQRALVVASIEEKVGMVV